MVSGDVYLAAFDDAADKTNVIKFNSAKPISSTSEIVFFRPTITNGSYIACDSWTPAVHDHATERIFTIMDNRRNANYAIYRDVDSLRVAAMTSTGFYSTINFDYNTGNDDTVINPQDVPNVQYIADGTYVDEPADPVSEDGYEFLGWYVPDKNTPNKYIKYDFTSETSNYELYEATRSTVYAKWNKNIKLSVWGNSGGQPADRSTTFGDTEPYKVVYTVPMGGKISEAVETKAYRRNGSEIAGWTTATGYTRDGLTMIALNDNNGWNNGLNDGDWGNVWKVDSSEWLVDDDKSALDFAGGNLYVSWRGTEFKLNYDLNDTKGTTRAAMDMTGKATVSYFNDRVGTTEYPLPTPTRDGYTFINWHSASESQFSKNNVVISGETVYKWTEDLTLYAEWEANEYVLSYTVGSNDSAYGNMNPTKLVFDATRSITANAFKVSGKDFMYWVSTDSTTGVIKRYEDKAEVINLATKSGAEVVFEARFAPQVRTITFDYLNFVTGQTTYATISQASMSVTYGERFGAMPTPTRPGYTFGGWYIAAKAANTTTPDPMYLITSETMFDETLTGYDKTVPWTVSSGVYTMKDITISARWVSNLWTVKSSSGVSDDDDLPATGDDVSFDTAFDYYVNYAGAPKTVPAFPKAQYKREGYTYLGLFGEYKGQVATVNNVSAKVTLAKDTPLHNLGFKDIASGSVIVLTASWSEFEYDLVIRSGHEALEVEGRIPTLVQGATETTIKKIKYSDKKKILDYMQEVHGGKKYKIDGYEFLGFTGDKGEALNYDDIVSGATFSNIIGNKTGVTITLVGHWDKNSYTISYKNARTVEEAAKVTGGLNPQKMTVGGAATALYSVSKPTAAAGTKLGYLGHQFDYWLDEGYVPGSIGKKATYSDMEKVYDLRTEQGAVATLSAVWKANRYNVYFEANEPNSPSGERNPATGNKDPFLNVEYTKEFNIGTPGYMVKGYTSKFFGNKNTRAKSTIIVTASEVVKSLAGSVKDGDELTLNVLWEANKYKVKLDMNDGNSDSKAVPVVSSMSFTYDAKLGDAFKEIAANGAKAPTRPGYKFVGWTKTPVPATGSGVKIAYTEFFRPDDLDAEYVDTWYAWWQPQQYTLTIDAGTIDGQNGHTKTQTGAKTTTMKVRYDQKISDITPLPMTYLGGYEMTFFATASEWQPGHMKVDDNTIYNFATDNYTIYAQYKPIPFTVKFDKAGDTEVEGTMADQHFTYGEKQNLREVIESSASSTFKKKGYSFTNWTYTNKETKYYNNLSKAEVAATYVNKATISRIRESSGSTAILTPNWKEHTYTIKFDPATTSASQKLSGNVADMTLKYSDKKFLNPNRYAIVGYDFKGWVDASNPNKKYTDRQEIEKLAGERYGKDGEDQVITLKATWEPKAYDILFVRNDRSSGFGSTIASISVAGVDKGQERVMVKATFGETYPEAIWNSSAAS